MEDQRTAVLGLCTNRQLAERAIGGLLEAGIMNNAVSVLLADDRSTAAGTLGLLACVTTVFVPGLGRAIVGGPLARVLNQLTVPTDALGDALAGIGVPVEETGRCDAALNDGAVLLGVHCNSGEQISPLTRFLERLGVTDIFRSGGVRLPGENQLRPNAPDDGRIG